MAIQTAWHITCILTFSTRNHLRIYSAISDNLVSKTLNVVADKYQADILGYNYGVKDPDTGHVQYDHSAMQIHIRFCGQYGPTDYYQALRKELWTALQPYYPTQAANPIQRNCLIADLDNYTDDTARQYIKLHTWRHANT